MAHPLRIAAFLTLLAVAACTGPGADPSSLQPLTANDPQTGSGQLPPPSQSGDTTNGSLSGNGASSEAPRLGAINSNARVQFAPAIGVAAEAVPALAARLRSRASQRGISVVQATDNTTTHVMKGYFSAFTDNGETTVIYVWDVLDRSGNRLHRIQGQQKQPGATGEGWSTVTPPTMEAIADRTIDELAAWLSATAG